MIDQGEGTAWNQPRLFFLALPSFLGRFDYADSVQPTSWYDGYPRACHLRPMQVELQTL